jgi:hypothetical protein
LKKGDINFFFDFKKNIYIILQLYLNFALFILNIFVAHDLVAQWLEQLAHIQIDRDEGSLDIIKTINILKKKY